MTDFALKLRDILQRDKDRKAEAQRLNAARLKAEDDDRKIFVSTVSGHVASLIPGANQVMRQFDYGELELTDCAPDAQFNSVAVTYRPNNIGAASTMVLSISPARKISCKADGSPLRETSISAPKPERFEIEQELQTFLEHVLRIGV